MVIIVCCHFQFVTLKNDQPDAGTLYSRELHINENHELGRGSLRPVPREEASPLGLCRCHLKSSSSFKWLCHDVGGLFQGSDVVNHRN